jgi:hypothetical protein
MRYGVASLVFAAVVATAVLATQPAGAMKPYLEQFKSMYVKSNTKDRNMMIFNEAVEKKGCTICHGAKSKKSFNAYGLEVKKLLSKSDMNNSTKIRAALTKVGRIKSKADDSSSPTFGDRIRQGKLPVGEIHVRSKEDAN